MLRRPAAQFPSALGRARARGSPDRGASGARYPLAGCLQSGQLNRRSVAGPTPRRVMTRWWSTSAGCLSGLERGWVRVRASVVGTLWAGPCGCLCSTLAPGASGWP
eukprot:262699-Lingulodinium_polyedra.AAC.1